MQTIELSYPHSYHQEEFPETVAAIGFFDGIHRGHQKVIRTAIDKAKESGRSNAVITFYPHPSVVLQQDVQHVRYLTPLDEKKQLLAGMGVERLYVVEFNKQLSSLSPEAFVRHFLIGLDVKHLVAGFDFTFGYKGRGNMKNITTYAEKFFTVTTIDKVVEADEKISSTLIRKHLEKGNIKQANYLLGRPFAINGVVTEGDKRGRTIGYPTANLKLTDEYLLPRTGVYAVKAVLDGKSYKGMANLGYKPTFYEQEEEPSIEVHLFDFQKDIYGKEITVEWLRFIREEQKFAGVDELVNQIQMDEQQIRELLEQI